ncbi:LysM peptidoglycan-binding domain-containing protein [Brevibacterium sp. UCMA 11754]|uniref:LysM peptidoglycan-binding domain-containing protein n=1 Tax=Brevibacterium sp. UCMA 11754 TaxID=2749198 RepID=UPI001F16FB81|nr:LysM domain-containing protein [Brevibacterium sp. UCMA 11754]MCF2574204.1 LysM peptidoglycan-binding domain-containing protein [Brevibacterium sp. UCMA 11754]
MYLLIACSVSWLCLIGAFVTTWVHLPTPRSTTDLVVIIVVGTAAVLSSRLGVVSLLTLLIRLLPDGRLRTIVTESVVRIVPTILRSSVLAAASASLAVNAAQASPLPADTLMNEAHAASAGSASATLDPGWPTALPDDPPPDPGWPTAPPKAEPTSPVAEPELPDAEPSPSSPKNRPPQDAPGNHDEGPGIYIVGTGESLWSIAADQPSSGGTTQDIVDDIYSANRDVIGANPNLIMPGQRLEIQP